MQGPPYYVDPGTVLTSWTLPQMLFTYLGIQERTSADARSQFTLTVAAIGVVFSKDGQKYMDSILDALEGGPLTVDELFDTLSEEQQLVLFGQDRIERLQEH